MSAGGAEMAERERLFPAPGWPRVLIAFAIIFAVYQTAEGLQTVFAPASPFGPALMLAALLIAWPLGRWLGWRGYDAYGLDMGGRSLRLLAAGLLLAALAKGASLAVGLGIGAYLPPSAFGLGLSPSFVGTALLTTFVPSLAEDILARGFLLRTIPVRFGLWPYVLASAALFAANHIWRFDWGLSEQIRLFCLGLAYAAAAWRWRTLWAAAALHWGWNLANVLAGAILPLEAAGLVDGRMVTAGMHLVLFAIVMLLPAPRDPSA